MLWRRFGGIAKTKEPIWIIFESLCSCFWKIKAGYKLKFKKQILFSEFYLNSICLFSLSNGILNCSELVLMTAFSFIQKMALNGFELVSTYKWNKTITPFPESGPFLNKKETYISRRRKKKNEEEKNCISQCLAHTLYLISIPKYDFTIQRHLI